MELQTILDSAGTVAMAGAGGLTGSVLFMRYMSRAWHTEKKDTAIDLASQSIYENLTKENHRMADQMTTMSLTINTLLEKNQHLSIQIADLTIEVKELRAQAGDIKDLEDMLEMKNLKIAKLERDLAVCERRGVII